MTPEMGNAQGAAMPAAASFSLSRFTARHASIRDEFVALWAATPPEMPEIGPRIGFLRHRANARAAARLIDELAGDLEQRPGGAAERAALRERVRQRLHQFGEARLGWPDGYRRLLFGDAFYESAVAFTREARRFNPGFTLEQLGQALRNVWIGNSLQMLLDLPVRLRPGLSAYSMLYPVTDNWLDDPGIASDSKRSFNERFGQRLAGLPVCARGEPEAAAWRLVERIEEEFPRDDCPSVYASLLAIHGGQLRSLRQHDGVTMTDAELLSISVEKGGSSVSADLHLVAGQTTPAEERFTFGFGVFLQLLDDLQDVEADRAAAHETVFTRAARRGPLDEAAGRLARFIDAVLADARFSGPAFADRIDLIRRNCRALLVSSVAEHPKRFSRSFRRRLARQWPVSFRSQSRLRRRAVTRWRALESRSDIASSVAGFLDSEPGNPGTRTPTCACP
jgi:hypothetical protein